jgi:hypothetical protein
MLDEMRDAESVKCKLPFTFGLWYDDLVDVVLRTANFDGSLTTKYRAAWCHRHRAIVGCDMLEMMLMML